LKRILNNDEDDNNNNNNNKYMSFSGRTA
jgi:hypothetical protein